MSRFFRKSSSPDYEPTKLVNARFANHPGWDENPLHVICDIDKTWLETHFESVIGMAKIAFEKAQDKLTVAGASEVLSAIRWGDENREGDFPHPLHFVSSSPPQLRGVLEEKMILDHIDWTSDTFKDQSYNVRKGRWDLLKQQVPYKTIAILQLLNKMKSSTKLIFLGDNAEADPFIYLGIYLFLCKKIDQHGFLSYLKIGGIEDGTLEKIQPFLDFDPKQSIQLLGIRELPTSEKATVGPLTDPIFWFKDYFSLSVQLTAQGTLTTSQLSNLALVFHNDYGFSMTDLLASCCQFGHRLVGDKHYDVLLQKLQSLSEGAGRDVQPYVQNLETFHQLCQDDILLLAQKWHQSMVATEQES